MLFKLLKQAAVATALVGALAFAWQAATPGGAPATVVASSHHH